VIHRVGAALLELIWTGSSFGGRWPDAWELSLGVRWTIGDRSSMGQWVAAEETPRVEFAR